MTRPPGSLSRRLLVAATVSLVGFFALTGTALDKAYRDSAEKSQEAYLQGQLYGLLSAAELNIENDLVFPPVLAEPRLANSASGLFATVHDARGTLYWYSKSFLGHSLETSQILKTGSTRFQRSFLDDGEWFEFSYGISWEIANNQSLQFTFSVFENLDRYHVQLKKFRQTLWISLAAVTLLLLLVLAMVLRWGLSPLRQVADEIRAIEIGGQTSLKRTYPHELQTLTSNINAMIRNERRNIDRHKNTLADLAHSLKTPLAVLRGITEKDVLSKEDRETADQQITDMARIMDYQLRKSGTRNVSGLAGTVNIASIVDKLKASLEKVYLDKAIEINLQVDQSLTLSGVSGDYWELFGNLMDNACKHCYQRVRIIVKRVQSDSLSAQVIIDVEDDGPGLEKQVFRQLMRRGVRGDESKPGQGIGLAVVQEIVHVSKGTIHLVDSVLGGTHIQIKIPQP